MENDPAAIRLSLRNLCLITSSMGAVAFYSGFGTMALAFVGLSLGFGLAMCLKYETVQLGLSTATFDMHIRRYALFMQLAGGDKDETETGGIFPEAPLKSKTAINEEVTPRHANTLSKSRALATGPKPSGLLPKSKDKKIRIFTFGLFLIASHGRMRAGFIKRHQILIRA